MEGGEVLEVEGTYSGSFSLVRGVIDILLRKPPIPSKLKSPSNIFLTISQEPSTKV